MENDFDPYHQWLGIPREDQPPHHYRLLGINLFEDNLKVIETASDRQMVHLRTFQIGAHSAQSQKLLNDVAAARICLLNARRKTEYDESLRARLATTGTAAFVPTVLDVLGIDIEPPTGHRRTSTARRGSAPLADISVARDLPKGHSAAGSRESPWSSPVVPVQRADAIADKPRHRSALLRKLLRSLPIILLFAGLVVCFGLLKQKHQAASNPVVPASGDPLEPPKPAASSGPADSHAENAASEKPATAKSNGQANEQEVARNLVVDLGEGITMEFVRIPAGEFLMGTSDTAAYARPNESPQHLVRITKPFYLGMYPVTQEQWQTVMGINPSKFKGAKNPVESVSWRDCQTFIDRLNAIGHQSGTFQLPTEAQWEYACRAGSTTKYSFGDDDSLLEKFGWYDGNSGGKTRPVGEKEPNAWGLYEMQGNVWNWCADWYDFGYVGKSESDDPVGKMSGSLRVYRGGSWSAAAGDCRSAIRGGADPDYRDRGLGFRVNLVPVSQ